MFKRLNDLYNNDDFMDAASVVVVFVCFMAYYHA
jgi:hypothetical protein